MEEFLSKLRNLLSGEISNEEVEKQLLYYRNYILNEKIKGKSEKDIINDLGDPVLIARSIIDADKIGKSGSGSYTYVNEDTYNKYSEQEGDGTYKGYWFQNLTKNKCLGVALLSVIAFLFIIAVVLYIVFTLIRILFYPSVVIIALAIIWLFFMYFNKK